MRRQALAFLAVALVTAAVVGAVTYSFTTTRSSDLAAIDAKFARVTCDSLGREVASRQGAVVSGELFAKHLKSPVLRAYYKGALPTRRDRADAAWAEYDRLGCREQAT